MDAFLRKYYGLIPLALFCVFYTFKAVDFPLHDFANYYFGGDFLRNSHFTAAIYFPYEFNQKIATMGYSGVFASYAPNTPFLSLLFLPLSLLPALIAKILFNSISVVLFIYSLSRLASYYKINWLALLALPFLFFVPIKNELLFGQIYFLLFFLLSESWLSYLKNEPKKMAVLLAIAILLKVFPVFLIFVFLFRKQFRLVLYVGIVLVALVLFSMLFTGWEVWNFYITAVLPKALNGEISGIFVPNYQSFFMFLKELLIYDQALNKDVVWDNPVLFSALMLGFKTMVVAIGFYISRKVSDSLLVLSYWILAAILLSPYGSSYTFILLVFLFLGLLQSEFSKWKMVVGFILIFAINNLPLSYFIDTPFPFSYLRFLILMLLFMLFCVALFKIVNGRFVLAATCIPIVLMLFLKKNTKQESTIILEKNMPILIYDYQLSNNKLTYFYWNELGENKRTIPFSSRNAIPLALKDNQVFYNEKQLTFDEGNKMKPILVGKNLLFLSDINKGIGFYTLRKIAVN